MERKEELLSEYLVKAIDEVMIDFTDETKKEIEKNTTITEKEQKNRKKLIDIKVNHSKRVASDIQKVFDNQRFDKSWGVLGYFIGQIHDIGRYLEGENANSFYPGDVNKYYSIDFSDTEYDWVKEHSSLGTALLVNKSALHEIWNMFKLTDEQEVLLNKLIGEAVFNHQKDQPIKEESKIDLYSDAVLLKSNIFYLLINNKISLQNLDKVINFYNNIVRDIDKVDILYQHLTGEFPVLRETTNYLTLNDDLDTIANYWGLAPQDILAINEGVDKDLIKDGQKIAKVEIPVKSLKPEKLFVPKDVEDMFYSNTIAPKLRELQDRRDWTPLTGMLWRLSTFLDQAKFNGTLRTIKDSNLLDNILATYPVEYQTYMKKYFDYSKDTFLNNINTQDLYVDKNKGISKTR